MQAATRLMTIAVLDGDETLWQETRATLEGQTTDDWQSLVIQNTPDRSVAASEDIKTVVLRQPKRQSLSLCWKRAIRFALTRWEKQDLERCYVVFTRPGALFGQESLKRFLDKFDREPGIGMLGATVCAATQEQDADERRIYAFSNEILSAGQALNRFRRPIALLKGRDRKELVSPMAWFAPAPHVFVVRASLLSSEVLAPWLEDDSLLPFSPDILMSLLTVMGVVSERLDDATVWWPASLSLARGKSVLEQLQCRRMIEAAMDHGFWRFRHSPWLLLRMFYGFFLVLVSPASWSQLPRHWRQRFEAYRWHAKNRRHLVSAAKRRAWYAPLAGSGKI